MKRDKKRKLKHELKVLAARLLAALLAPEGCKVSLPADGFQATEEETRQITDEVLAELSGTKRRKKKAA